MHFHWTSGYISCLSCSATKTYIICNTSVTALKVSLNPFPRAICNITGMTHWKLEFLICRFHSSWLSLTSYGFREIILVLLISILFSPLELSTTKHENVAPGLNHSFTAAALWGFEHSWHLPGAWVFTKWNQVSCSKVSLLVMPSPSGPPADPKCATPLHTSWMLGLSSAVPVHTGCQHLQEIKEH